MTSVPNTAGITAHHVQEASLGPNLSFVHSVSREDNFGIRKAAAEGGCSLLVMTKRLGRHYLHLVNQKWHQRELVLQTINERHNNETNHIIDRNEVIRCNEYRY